MDEEAPAADEPEWTEIESVRRQKTDSKAPGAYKVTSPQHEVPLWTDDLSVATALHKAATAKTRVIIETESKGDDVYIVEIARVRMTELERVQHARDRCEDLAGAIGARAGIEMLEGTPLGGTRACRRSRHLRADGPAVQAHRSVHRGRRRAGRMNDKA